MVAAKGMPTAETKVPRATMETSTAVKATSSAVPTTLGKGRLRRAGERDACHDDANKF